MQLRLTTLLAVIYLQTGLIAQNKISGTISNAQKEGIYFATIALYQQTDSTLVSGTSTDDQGNFQLKNIKNGAYYLEASMLGYQTSKIANLNFPQDNGRSLNLTLSEDATVMETVEVTAKVPLLEQKADRLVVNVADNLTSLNGNLLDVMKKVPGMLVVGDQLRMAGQANITILINGKTTRYMDINSLLKDMPGDNIQKVEVIHQPGAEFDAEGTGAVINIILKKNSLFGTNGSVNLGIAKGNDWKYTTGLNLSHYQGKLNVSGSIGYKDYPYWDETGLVRRVGDDIYDQLSTDPYENRSLRGNMSLDWDITNKHRVGFSGRFVDWSSDNLILTTTSIDFGDPQATDLLLNTRNTKEEVWDLFSINPYYRFEIDTTGHQIDFDVNIVSIATDGENIIRSEETNIGANFAGQRYLQPGSTELFTTKLDYSYPFSNDFKLQMGLKYSDATLDNNLMAFLSDELGDWKTNPLQSNHYIFEETIKAAYSKITFNKDKWSGSVGLRYEDSQSEGYSVTLDSTLNRDISKFFPSASLSRNITDKLGTTLAYSYRIDRPNYSSLNPFVYYLDQFTFQRGNPSLTPSLTHSMKFNLSYEKQPFFNVEYKSTRDAMVEVTDQNDATGEASLTTVNLESFKNLNISLYFPLDFIPGVTGYGGVIANYGKFESEYLDDIFDRSKWDYTGFLQAEFKLPQDIKSTVTGWYNSGGQQGIINATWLYGVDVGFSKSILEDKAKISLGVENLLARYMYADINYANMDLDIYSRWDGPVVNMQFSYKFGNQHFKSKESRKSSASEELNRINAN